MAEGRLEEFYKEISEDLTRTMRFWMDFSHDTEYGGFFNCIGPTGQIYDDTKYVWFQGRQVWMYARLYNEESEYKTPEVLQTAKDGAQFLQKYAVNPETHKCYLSLTRDGKPIKIQRTIYSECFYALAMSEMYRATNEAKFREEALLMMDKIVYWVRKDSTDIRLGLPALSGNKPVNTLAVPMMLLCLINQMELMDAALEEKYSDDAEWSLNQARAHIQRNGTRILENVSTNGVELPGSAGRLMVPGHSIEAGWFLLQYAKKKNNKGVIKIAIENFIVNPFKYGWDESNGGLYYFLDVDGYSPIQLEWNMKLWWTHSETLIAFLMAYQETADATMLEKFAQVFDYCYQKHVDRVNGEWYGYLNQDGTVSINFKGGPYKGCFHVPRALLYCKQILKDILKK